ncbi:MAG: undecaprenyl/decaprenyl-phosphate alpha-N-acetylglucosaminyl 1-phosphate transferase [Proteobacteria bacterium]|nr:undecaprenyl/decaprenyl-phosphate alpha-N-acetylglucosaminyl 1-phosphate transferase [Pseudomonadota bacterium]
MPEAVRVGLALVLPALLVFLTVPAAIRIAHGTGFLDRPKGYKAHLRPTPYLGGAAVLVAALPIAAVLGLGLLDRYWPLVAGAVFFAVVGAIDDRVNLSPWFRLAVEAGAGLFLWAEGLGWTVFESDLLDLLLSALWVMALVNAFNLMDNLDGAAAGVAAVSAGGIATLASIGGDTALTVLGVSLVGALAGFLRFNLARPSRIFLGDGGSMPIGFLVAGALMSVPMGRLSGWETVLAAALIAGLPIFDTTLVMISRRRRGVPLLTGGTDHTTHRLLVFLRTPRVVVSTLTTTQACLCAFAIEATRLGTVAVTAVGCAALVLAAASIAIAESPGWTPLSHDS